MINLDKPRDRNIIAICDDDGSRHAIRVKEVLAVSNKDSSITLRFGSGLIWTIKGRSAEEALDFYRYLTELMNSSYVD